MDNGIRLRNFFPGTLADETMVRVIWGALKTLPAAPASRRGTARCWRLRSRIVSATSRVSGRLEQLAAGLPRRDDVGPRQILHGRARFLTPVGDTAAIAARAAEILSLSLPEYEKLSAECRAIAGRYRWNKIARETLDEFRAALNSLGESSTG